MYPLLLKPPIKDYLWGGTKLKADFGFETDKDITAEAWMLSAHSRFVRICSIPLSLPTCPICLRLSFSECIRILRHLQDDA